MKTNPTHDRGFTFVELLVVVAIITALVILRFPTLAGTKANVQRINCSNNLKKTAVAFRTWSESHNGRMPMAVSSFQGGGAEAVGTRATGVTFASNISPSRKGVFGMFVVMSNELITPKILYCPSEYRANILQGQVFGDTVGSTNGFYNDNGTSYFVGVDANDTQPNMFLTGDHNLGDSGNPPGAAQTYGDSSKWFMALGTNAAWGLNAVGWANNQHRLQGNVALADGSVQNFTTATLRIALNNTKDVSRFSSTFVLANGSLGSGVNRLQFP